MIRAIKGTRDLLPPDTAVWNRVERIAHDVFHAWNYHEIRTPILEEIEQRLASTLKPKLLFTPGPLTTSPTVKAAMLRDAGSRDAEFIETVRDIRRRERIYRRSLICADAFTAAARSA